MRGVSWGIIVGATIGLVSGALLAVAALLCVRFQKKRARLRNSSSLRAATAPMRTNGVDACAEPSDASTVGQESPVRREANARGLSFWVEESRRRNPVSFSGVLKYLYKDLQKATRNFTTLIGQGAFGPVYTAQMATGEIVAVKVLASNSKQGEREFQSEVLLLGRLHHRNLVNLVGYCAEKGQYMLVYVYMSNGSLASHLYGEKHEPLSWDSRVNIALDVARGLEYLHDGAIPPVVHRDIKSANILLDHSMVARAAMDAGGRDGWEEIADSRLHGDFDVRELNDIASLAYKCTSRISRKRPSMRDMVQSLSKIINARNSRIRRSRRSFPTAVEASIDIETSEYQSSQSEHQREESLDSLSDFPEV
ncbi:calcium/calmodulin-regulated receptor-like kinase 1 isoform X2 [Zingiber officinale]|uniref:calcium/calmodulin-regulated receptor-like kinase 1 isoform X2 n=1 Tax=Zingiber officinale TaxID=94328 RepID=UPI001C4C3FC4|nr:calcium/calmodulin-regulated receptor-like kinase 1 isoform X2 [Zingiber officinale]